ncbi:MAG: isochorismatase [Firmicutes bacterium]|nr:isochorismatase [Bacillota bacterium]
MKRHWEKIGLLVSGLILAMSLLGCVNKPLPEHASENYDEAAAGQTILDEWETIAPPPVPELKSFKADAKTALLILDMQNALCKNPRSIASIPMIDQLLSKARGKDILVVYSLLATGKLSDIVPELAPAMDDPIVESNVDKFYNTDLDKILREHNIKTLIITGTAANGAVLNTATGAIFRGYRVVIPIEGMSAENPYAEQYTVWHMLNSPGTRNWVTLTKVSLISF